MHLSLDHLSPARRYLIGVSGGRDSVALLHALHEQGYGKLIVCHVNHRLRGRASAQDAAFVQRLAKKLGYECECAHVDVAAFAKDSRQSMETAAREARHAFFAAMARKHRCPRVLLAHHADDQAETVLMRVLRGTGIGGLGGMRAETEMGIGAQRLTLLRPLLGTRRAEIDAYVREHGLKYREDATNADEKLTRNRVRKSLLPMIHEAGGRDVTPLLLRLAMSASLDDDLLKQMTLALIDDHALIDAGGSLLLKPAMKEAHEALQLRVIHEWLRRQEVSDLDHDTVRAVVRLLTQKDPARVNLTKGLQVRRKAGRLSVGRQ